MKDVLVIAIILVYLAVGSFLVTLQDDVDASTSEEIVLSIVFLWPIICIIWFLMSWSRMLINYTARRNARKRGNS